MAQRIRPEGLESLARDLLARPGRHILAIAGPPGAGKSTVAERLAARLDPDTTAVLPMDGFHYDDAVLHLAGRHPWKGAPDTFDVGGLHSALTRLRETGASAVAVPVFDRDLEISRGSARIIGPQVRLILAEGNYLLLDQAPWASLRPLFDARVLIEVPEAELRRRLARRWQGHGLTAAQIGFKLEQNDLPNGRLVAAASSGASHVLHFA